MRGCQVLLHGGVEPDRGAGIRPPADVRNCSIPAIFHASALSLQLTPENGAR
jgi:hypothetical protein